MARWTGQTITLQIGAKWNYKLELREESDTGGRSDIVLGRATFNSEQEAKAGGDAHLKAEIERRSR